MSVYGRLGFDFDTSKFGDSITLQPNVLEYVNNSKPVITSTVESELVTPINRSDYFIIDNFGDGAEYFFLNLN